MTSTTIASSTYTTDCPAWCDHHPANEHELGMQLLHAADRIRRARTEAQA